MSAFCFNSPGRAGKHTIREEKGRWCKKGKQEHELAVGRTQRRSLALTAALLLWLQ